jgi:hypothetical protein
MKNKLDRFEALARRARHDVPPSMDVSHHVIYRIEAMADESIDRPLAWLTLGSMAMAAVMGSFAFSTYSTLADPMGLLFQVTPLLGN